MVNVVATLVQFVYSYGTQTGRIRETRWKGYRKQDNNVRSGNGRNEGHLSSQFVGLYSCAIPPALREGAGKLELSTCRVCTTRGSGTINAYPSRAPFKRVP